MASLPPNTRIQYLDDAGNLVLGVAWAEGNTKTINIKLSTGERVADFNGRAANNTIVKLNADGSVYSYDTEKADGSFLRLIFDEPTAQTRTTFGPNGEYVRGALTSSSSYTRPPGSPPGSQGYLETKSFENGVMTAYQVKQVGGDFSFVGTVNDDGKAAATLLTPLSPEPLKASGIGTLNGLASISSRDLYQSKGGLLIGQDGGSLIGQDGGSLIGQDGGSIISRDSAGLIGQDGGSLIGQDGGSLVAAGGGNIVAAGGGNFTARQFTTSASAASTVDPAAASGAHFAFNLMSDLLGRGPYSANSFASREGDAGDNGIVGGLYDDVLRGRMGADFLDGGAGNDTLYGGDSDFIRNGSFETVYDPQLDANGYGYNEPVDGWTLVSGARLELFKAGAAGTPADGRYGVDLEGNQTNTNVAISQIVRGLLDGQTYRLAFEARKISPDALARLQVSFGGQTLNWTIGGTTKAYIDPGTSTLVYYIDVTGGTGTGTDRNRLTFSEIGDGDTQGTLLDKVRMYRVESGTPKAADDDPYSDGNDTFSPGTGSDLVYGHGGDDAAAFSDVGPGTDEFAGGSGTDLLIMDWSASTTAVRYTDLVSTFGINLAPRIGQARSYERDGAASGERGQKLFFNEVERFILKGGKAGDVLVGGELKDLLSGNGGDDTLIGNGGADEIDGGAGFDRAVIKLSGNGANRIDLKTLKTGGTLTLSDGTKLTSIEALDLIAGEGDDVLDVRGTVANPGNLPASDPGYPVTGTRFEGLDGNDTLSVDLATSREAFFGGGSGAGDLLIMDWSAATRDIFRSNESYGGSYQSFWKTVSVSGNATNLYFKVGFSGVERFDLTGGTGNDTLYGGDKDDRIKTIGGRDVAHLSGGFDTLVVDYTAQAGSFRFDPFRKAAFAGSLATGYSGSFAFGDADYGSSGIDFTGVERFELFFGAGDDRLRGGDADDILSGGAGNDYLNSLLGTDVVDGGAHDGAADADGGDRWEADKSSLVDKTGKAVAMVLDLNLSGIQARYNTTGSVRGIEMLTLKTGEADDRIVTLRTDRADTIDAGGGADRVTVYGGRDTVAMGANGTGQDTLVVDYTAQAGNFQFDPFRMRSFEGTLATGYSGAFAFGDAQYGTSAIDFTGVERFELFFGAGNDRLRGGDADDSLSGGAGNDYLNSLQGTDVVDGGAHDAASAINGGGDRWEADKSSLVDRTGKAVAILLDLNLSGVQATYNTNGSVRGIEMLTLKTGAADDRIATLRADRADTIDTGGGADRVSVYGGRDTVAMGANGAGQDTLVVDFSAQPGSFTFNPAFGPQFEGTLATGYSGSFAFGDSRYGTSEIGFSGVERFELFFGAGNDALRTGDADDVLNGGGGTDLMSGYGGNDTYVVDNAADQAIEAVGGGTDTVKASVSYTLALNEEIEVLATILDTATTVIDLTGNERANTLRGNAGKNILDGGAGIDQLYGLGGNDTYLVDDVSDRVFEAANGGTDTVRVASNLSRYTLLAGQQVEALVAADPAGTTLLDLIGNEFGQSLVGNAGANILKGGGGNDALDGGSGADTADYGDKTVGVQVTLSGSVAAVVKVGGVAEDIVVRIENVTGGSANDTLTGDGAANVFDGGAGNDVLTGMAGSDTYVVDSASDQVFEAAGAGTDTVKTSVSYALAANQEIETLRTASDSVTSAINLTGNERGNTLRGNAGANILDGGLGNDTMYGLAGNDTYFVDSVADRTYELAGGGTDTVKAAASTVRYALLAGQEVEALVAADPAGTTALDLIGNEFGQSITGNAGANLLRGGRGADTLNGGVGIDTADYGDKSVAVEVILNGAVAATVKVNGVAEDTVVKIENVIGGTAADKLTGDGGGNVLDGGKGIDVLTGMAGNDTYLVDNAADQVIEAAGGGTDTVKASASYALATNQQIENLFTTNDAGTGAINLTGNALGQTITGNAGANVLIGGGGVDRVTGGLGNDVFDFNAASDTGATAATRDVILDFTQGQDRIDLSTIDANGAAAGGTFVFVTQKGATFTGTAGQLVYAQEDRSGTANDRTILSGDIDGDRIADFQIELTGLITLTGDDLVL